MQKEASSATASLSVVFRINFFLVHVVGDCYSLFSIWLFHVYHKKSKPCQLCDRKSCSCPTAAQSRLILRLDELDVVQRLFMHDTNCRTSGLVEAEQTATKKWNYENMQEKPLPTTSRSSWQKKSTVCTHPGQDICRPALWKNHFKSNKMFSWKK